MKVLTNISSYRMEEDWFKSSEEARLFLKNTGLDGFEVIFFGVESPQIVKKEQIFGIHLMYWPTWIDFWRGNEENLLAQFTTWDNVEAYYGGRNRQVLIDHYKKEFKRAKALAAHYMVFHVSHVGMNEIFNFEHIHEDKEVLQATAELINEVFKGEDTSVALLFENLWWPGLNFKNPELALWFLDQIEYSNKGFVLDVGHLMITNPKLQTHEEACSYMLNQISYPKDFISHIRAIHLNCSLTGDYISKNHSSAHLEMIQAQDMSTKYDLARTHISQIDLHLPFQSPCIKSFIEKISPDYLVYEFLADTMTEAEALIKLQSQYL